MTESEHRGVSSNWDGAPRLCSKCKTNLWPGGTNPWCKPCRQEYGKEWRAKNRQRPTFSQAVCADPTCREIFIRTSERKQRYCSKKCYSRCYKRARRTVDAATTRAWQFKSRGYGITPAEFDALVEAQESRCAICSREAKLVPDHCHDTSTFRGAICQGCNIGIGQFGNDPARLRAAAEYLEIVSGV
ncbi:hypothetical protein GCM10028801_30820 [Nocardioides maradonensis]